MKKMKHLLIISVCMLLLAACGESSSTTESSETDTNYESVESESSISEIDSLDVEIEEETLIPKTEIQTGEYVKETYKGYQIKVNTSVTQWIKGDNRAVLENEWQYFGEEVSNLGTLNATSAYLIGEVSVENMSKDFPFGNIDGFPLYFYIDSDVETDSFENFEITSARTQYVNGAVNGVKSDGTLHINPKMQSNEWGPVTFLIEVENAFRPRDPNGRPEFESTMLNVGFSGGLHQISHTGDLVHQTDSDYRNGRLEFNLSKTW